jgi:glycosyltransferase involved in cell wall biosynthesis
MVVLQVLPALGSGGVERGTIEMVQAIAQAGGTPLVASAGGPMELAVAHAGGEHIRLPLLTRDPLSILNNATKLARVIRERGVQIVHARSRAPGWSARIAARRTGAHFVTTYHGAYGDGWALKRRYNAVMAAGERVIAISAYIANLIVARHGVDPDRIRLIPRGVDPAVFDPELMSGDRMHRVARAWRLPDGARTVMLPARLSRWKGHEVLLHALARLEHDDLFCVFVGGGGRRGYAEGLAKLAARLGLEGRIRFAGQCDDMPAALMLSDVVVHASTKPEAFGRVVIEAQAMGRPVIAADLGGPVETVVPDETGWRVPPGEPDALAEAIDHALALPEEERIALGARARAWVSAHYTTQAMQAATLAVYRELLEP